MDERNQTYFDLLRKEHFPPERNFLNAHLTMFHSLPATVIEEAIAVLTGVADRQGSMDAEVSGLRSLGSGVAFTLRCPELEKLRDDIALAFREQLTAQDRQLWRPHITIQNKVSLERARDLLARLEQGFRPWTVSVEALELWRCNGGPWDFVDRFRFATATGPGQAAD